MPNSRQTQPAIGKAKAADQPGKSGNKPRRGKDFGEEGTNKTIPVPKPDGAPSEELGNDEVRHTEKSPHLPRQ
ncbi:MAG: hypothetical protein JWR68_631 [Polaromonas sp.]|nr:hypothetical protein [Polaromonas sp.]